MVAYLIRRLLYAVPIILGVVVLTFWLFFVVNKPDDMARSVLGDKAANDHEAIEKWKRENDYHLPLFVNWKAGGTAAVTQTLFFQKCARLLVFDMGRSDTTKREITGEIRRRMGPSLAFAVPTFLIGLVVNISTSLILAFCRGTYLDRWGTILCVLMMSISGLFYIIGGQYVFSTALKLFPVSGFDWNQPTAKFVFLPVLIGVVSGIGGSVRYYRTVMLEEIGSDYVRTARAKGLPEMRVLFRHVLKNAMIPILTSVVMAIPFLFLGSLLMESFFSIPGLGSMTITAIQTHDFAVVRAMVYIASILYILGLLMTDVSYTLVDPRISLGSGGRSNLYGSGSLLDALLCLVFLACVGGGMVGIYLAVQWAISQPAVANARVPALPALGLLAALGLGLAFWLRARRRVMWHNAWRQVRRNRLAMVSLCVVLVYVLIGVLDSIIWRNPATGPDGAPRRTTDGRMVYAEAESVLDRILRPLRRKERTYSAPLATHSVSKVTVDRKVAGKRVVERVHPELEHPRGHLLGTDKTGEDVLYKTFKGVRTGLIVGGITTLIAVPFAILFGVLAGFFGGWLDDLIQYIYSTLSTIPQVLLVVAFFMVFGQGLVQLCMVMALKGWVDLCRILRAETLKLREREYVQAALALGVGRITVIARHIVPNLMHLVLISIVLRFSGLVLAEAVLSYIGVGVGPDTYSWGTMINQARTELGHDPIIWWSLAGAFVAKIHHMDVSVYKTCI